MVNIPSAIYARVSPTTHIKTENDLHQSLQEAIEICKREAAHEGNPIVAIYYDEYVSGKDAKNMLDFQHMLDDAEKGINTAIKGGDQKTSWKRIYSRRVNRFGRNRSDMVKAEIKLTELGISLKFVENGIDTAIPFGKTLMAALAELAQMDLEKIAEDTKRGRDDVLLHGKPTKTGRPFGRPKKELNIQAIRQLRLLPVEERLKYGRWKQISKDFGASVSVIIQKLKDAGFWDYEKRCVK